MSKNNGQHLTHLFDVELKYVDQDPNVAGRSDRVGKYIGSGKGSVSGPQISGKIAQWDLYEEVSDLFCRSNLSGVIETNDRASITFDTKGFFKVPDSAQPHRWITSAAVHFQTEDENYPWLNHVLGVWEGTLNMETYTHHYKVYSREAA